MLKGIKNLKILTKIGILAGIIMIMNIAIFSVILSKTYDLSIGQAKAFAVEYSKNQSIEISKDIEQTEEVVGGIVSSIEALRKSGDLTREQVVELLKGQLASNESLVGIGTAWEPNVFDQKDKAYINKLGHDATGRFIPYICRSKDKIYVEPLVGYEVEGEGDWYLIPKKTQKPILTEPYIYSVNGVDVLMTTLAMPILDDNNKFLGVVTADIELSYLQQKIETLKPLGGYALFVSKDGTFVAHGLNKDKVLKKALEEDFINEKVLGDIKKGERGAYFFEDKQNHKAFLSTFEPINIKGVEDRWSFFTIIPKSNILEQVNHLLKISIGICIASLLVMTVIVMALAKDISTPIKHLKEVMKKAEEGDLTIASTLNRKDEFGDLSISFNKMLHNIKGLTRKVQEVAQNVEVSSCYLTDISKQTTEASETIANVVTRIATCAMEQSRESEIVVEKTLELADKIENVSTSSNNMKKESDNAAKFSKQGINSVYTLEEVAKVTSQYTQEVSGVVSKLNEKSSSIGEIVHVINGISEQTGLLSLNAAIEAARAGESGKGFAVVATEIKKLAEQSKDSTNKIGYIIQEIQEEITSMFKFMNKSSEIIAQNGEAVENTKQVFKDIATSVENVGRDIEEITFAMDNMNRSKDEIVNAITNISAVSEEQAASSEEVSASTEENTSAMSMVDKSAQDLNELAKILSEEINKFKA